MNPSSPGPGRLISLAARAALVVAVPLGLLVGLASSSTALPAVERKTCAVRVLNTAELLANYDTDYARAAVDDDARGWYRLDNGLAGASWVFQLNRGEQVRVRYGLRLNPY